MKNNLNDKKEVKSKVNNKVAKDKKVKTTKEKNIIELLENGKTIKMFFVGKTDFFVEKVSIAENILKKTSFVFVDKDGNIANFVLGNMHIAFSELEAYKAYNIKYDDDLKQYRFIPTKGYNDKVVDNILKDSNLLRENNFIVKQIKYEKILNILIYIEILVFLALLYFAFFVEWSIGLIGIIIEVILYYLVYEIMYLKFNRYYKYFTKGS